MQTEPFEFLGGEGQRLSGLLDWPSGKPRAFALFAHCFTCTKHSKAAIQIAKALTERGIGVLRFDFTGLGQSEGDFSRSTFSGSIEDLERAATAMNEAGFGPRLMIGHSLGGAAVLAAARKLPAVTAVAVIAAPFSPEHVLGLFEADLATILSAGAGEVRLGGRPFTIRKGFIEDLQLQDPATSVDGLARPMLILHSPIDQLVGIENAGLIFQAARHPKSYVSLDHADHLLSHNADAEFAAHVIAAWAARYLEAPAAAAEAPPVGTVHVDETGGGRFQLAVTTASGRLFADEPVTVGGLGSGPTPFELLSSALGACTAMTMRLYAEQKNWILDRVHVVVTHRKDRTLTPPDRFQRNISIDGQLDADQRRQLIAVAERCPVHRALLGGAAVETIDGAIDVVGPDAQPHEHLLSMLEDGHA